MHCIDLYEYPSLYVHVILTHSSIHHTFIQFLYVIAKGAKMGKVTAETSFKHLNAGTKFDLGAKYTSPLVDLSKPFNTIKKIVR